MTALAGDIARHESAMHDVAAGAASKIPRDFTQPQVSTPETLAAFRSTANDLRRRFGELHLADSRAAAATNRQIASLQRERDDLHAQIVASILTAAQEVAHAKDLGTLYTSNGPNDALDITPLVENAVRSPLR
jgi:hypothetical protein